MKVRSFPLSQVARLTAAREQHALERARRSAVALAEREQELARLDRALRALRERQTALRRELGFEADVAHVARVREQLVQLADDEQATLYGRAQLAALAAAAACEFAASTRVYRAMRRRSGRGDAFFPR